MRRCAHKPGTHQAIQECAHPDVRDRALLYYRQNVRVKLVCSCMREIWGVEQSITKTVEAAAGLSRGGQARHLRTQGGGRGVPGGGPHTASGAVIAVALCSQDMRFT